jgi:CheY-like chemotaxis protein
MEGAVSGVRPEGFPVPKILVADDNANIQKMVSLSFEDRGVEVVSVGNGEAAVRRIPDERPDVVLADIFMPVRNGYEVCEFVKKDSRFSHVPVILLVGAFDPLDEKEARRVGADGVLKKPFVPPDPLIAMVMSALERNPKSAAQLAKAGEGKPAPPALSANSILEPATSVRAESKPLPSFPEPTPEEEAVLYSTGSGRRTLDDLSVGTEASKEPQPPAGEFDQAAVDEFDGSATSRDWRRNAMDIEIPPDAATLPAFVTDDSSIFPSERDVPPRRVVDLEPAEETHSVPQSQAPASAFETVAPSARTSQSDLAASGGPAAKQETSTAISASPERKIVPAPDSAAVSPAGPSHWMDQLAQGYPDSPRSDRMNILSEQTAKRTILPVSETPLEHFTASVDAHTEVSKTEPEDSDSAAMREEASDQSFFDDEPASSLPSRAWFSPAQPIDQPSPAPETETIEHTAMDDVPVASKVEDNLEADSKPESLVAYRDPNLVQPPAIHVTPEPLLLDEELSAPAQYGSNQQQDLEPMHWFFARPPAASAGEAPATEGSGVPPSAEPVSEGKSAEAEVDELIPTCPPPNREALAEIPFLTPPPDFYTQPHERPAAATVDAETVDAVVQKVLEKLQPQLQDLLSRGLLKPLVENLLQSELAKKDK